MPFATNPADGVRIHHETLGSGKPVVMLHAMTTTGALWKRHGFSALLEHGYQLTLIDARAHGESGKPSDQDRHGGHSAMTADVVAVMDAAGIDDAHIIGYSMGATTGYLLARNASQRIRSLVLGGGPHTVPKAWEQGVTAVFDQGPEAVLAMFESSLGELTPERCAEILQLDTQALAAALVACAREPIPEAVFTTMNVPCLLYAGSDDTLACAQVERIAALIPDAELHVLPGLDHNRAAMESQQMLPRILEFFARIEPEDQ